MEEKTSCVAGFSKWMDYFDVVKRKVVSSNCHKSIESKKVKKKQKTIETKMKSLFLFYPFFFCLVCRVSEYTPVDKEVCVTLE